MKCSACTFENPEGVTKCLICGADMLPSPEIQAPPPPQLGTAAAQQQAQAQQPAAQAPSATQPTPPAGTAQTAQPAQPTAQPQKAPAQPEQQPQQPQQPAKPAAPKPQDIKTQSKSIHDILRVVGGVFWIILAIFALLIGIFGTIWVSSIETLRKPALEYGTAVPWIFIGLISFPVAINLFMIKKKLGMVSIAIGLLATILAIIMVSAVMYSSLTGWTPLIVDYFYFNGFAIMAGYIAFMVILFITKSYNEKLQFEQEQEYLYQTQSYQQYPQSQFQMTADQILNPELLNPSVEAKMIAITIMFMIAAVIIPVVLVNVITPHNSPLDNNTTVVSYSFPTIEVTLTDSGDADNDELFIRHISGDDLNWTKYKMVITSGSDDSKIAEMNDLSSLGILKNSDTTVIDKSIAGFNDIDYEEGEYYQIEIFLKKDNKRIYNKPYCNCEAQS